MSCDEAHVGAGWSRRGDVRCLFFLLMLLLMMMAVVVWYVTVRQAELAVVLGVHI